MILLDNTKLNIPTNWLSAVWGFTTQHILFKPCMISNETCKCLSAVRSIIVYKTKSFGEDFGKI